MSALMIDGYVDLEFWIYPRVNDSLEMHFNVGKNQEKIIFFVLPTLNVDLIVPVERLENFRL